MQRVSETQLEDEALAEYARETIRDFFECLERQFKPNKKVMAVFPFMEHYMNIYVRTHLGQADIEDIMDDAYCEAMKKYKFRIVYDITLRS